MIRHFSAVETRLGHFETRIFSDQNVSLGHDDMTTVRYRWRKGVVVVQEFQTALEVRVNNEVVSRGLVLFLEL